MLKRLRHNSVIDGDCQKRKVDPACAREHRVDEALVPRDIDGSDRLPRSRRHIGEAQVNRDAAGLLVLQLVANNAGQGLDLSLAFYLVVLQGYGPTIDMYTARDRTIGILFGNIVILVIFTTIWPVSVANVVRTSLAKALEQLAALVGLSARADGQVSQAARSAADVAFGQVIAQARAVLVNDPFETSEVRRAIGRRPIDAAVVEQVGRLFIPVSAILDSRTDRLGTTFRSQCTTQFTRITKRWQRGSGRQRHGRAAASERAR